MLGIQEASLIRALVYICGQLWLTSEQRPEAAAGLGGRREPVVLEKRGESSETPRPVSLEGVQHQTQELWAALCALGLWTVIFIFPFLWCSSLAFGLRALL